jgi:hypothetical protein
MSISTVFCDVIDGNISVASIIVHILHNPKDEMVMKEVATEFLEARQRR